MTSSSPSTAAAIKDGDDLVADISARKVGSTVKLGYLRSGKQITATVAIGDRAKTYADLANKDNDDDAGTEGNRRRPEQTRHHRLRRSPGSRSNSLNSGGVMVTSVRPGSFADEINLPRARSSPNQQQPVTDESSYRAIVLQLKPGDDVVFVVRDPQRHAGNTYVGGTLPNQQ